MQGLALGLRDGFHTVTWVTARQLLEKVSRLERQVHPNPRQRDHSYHTQILTLFPCFVVCDTKLSLFMCMVLFLPGHTQQPHISSLRFKALPIHQIKKGLEASPWPGGWEAAWALYTVLDLQLLSTSSCAIVILLWKDFFPAKNAWKMWEFCQIHLFFCDGRVAAGFAKPAV